MLQHLDDLRADAVVGIEIGADHADRKRRRLAGQRLADALGQHRIDFHQLIRIVVEHIADGGIDLARAAALPRIDLHLELALVRRIRILSVLGAADLLGDALDAREWRSSPLEILRADARGLGERYPGPQRGMRDQVILAEIRQQPRAEQAAEHTIPATPLASRRSPAACAAARSSQAIVRSCPRFRCRRNAASGFG